MASSTSPPKGALITGLVLLLLSLGGCGAGCVTFVGAASNLTDSIRDAQPTPAGTPVQTRPSSGWILIFGDRTDFSCEAVDSNGNQVNLAEAPAGSSSQVDRSGTTYEFLGAIEAVDGMRYTVNCATPELSGQYVVANITGFGGLVWGIGGVGMGIVLFVIGLIVLIVGLVKRSRWKKGQQPGFNGGAPYGTTPPPPGGAPPPPGAGAPGYGAPGYGGAPPQAPPPPFQGPPTTPPTAPPGPPSAPPAPPAWHPQDQPPIPPSGFSDGSEQEPDSMTIRRDPPPPPPPQ